MLNVLVIDDEKDIVKIIGDLYRNKFNSEVDTALNGEEGLALATQKCYDVICVDYCMPKLNGIDFLKQIKDTNTASSKALVLFITAYNPDLEVNNELWENVYFIKKPFIKDSIVNYTNMALSAKK